MENQPPAPESGAVGNGAHPSAQPQSAVPQAQQSAAYQAPEHGVESDKSFVTAWVLSLFFGSLGVDRFYRGMIITGILKLITLGGFGLWYYIDVLVLGFGRPKDKKGRQLHSYYKHHKIIKVLTALYAVFAVVTLVGLVLLSVFLAVPALQLNARNAARLSDVNLIANTMNKYQQINQSLPDQTRLSGLPQALTLCGTNCDTGSSETITLSYYTAADVSFASYLGELQAPDTDTIYIVNGASCNASKTGLGGTGTTQDPTAAAILYAVETPTNGVTQKCLQV